MAKNSKKGSGIVHDTQAGGLGTEREFSRERGKGESDTPQEVDQNMVEQERVQTKAAQAGKTVDEILEEERLEAESEEDESKEEE